MSDLYFVVDSDGAYTGFTSKEDAVDFAKRWADKDGRPHYLYKLVADVVVETRTVVEVIEHEQ